MTYLKFKSVHEPCIQYELIDPMEVMEYDEVSLHSYVPHIRISALGLVPKELMEETSHPDNINATDVLIYAYKLWNEI